MFRYIALVWNASAEAQSETADLLECKLNSFVPTWDRTLNRPGLKVYCTGARTGCSEPYLLANREGVVLGRLFSRATDDDTIPQRVSLAEHESRNILSSKGRSLVVDYWGRYVAFLHDTPNERTWVLRDPTGGLPCLSTKFRGVNVFFSRTEDCAQLGLSAFSINWRFVMAFLSYGVLHNGETGLNEISEVLSGQCIEFHRDQSAASFYWDPIGIAAAQVLEDSKAASVTLRRTARACVNAWASYHERVIHELSGGLDSSIVLSCLRTVPTRPLVTCVNYYSPGADSDEREYARLVAKHSGCELVERPRNSSLKLEPILRVPRSALPSFYLHYLENTRADARLARERLASAVLSGDGGDQVFYQSRALLAAGDFWRRQGLRPGLLGIVTDIARLERTSIWRVLSEVLRGGILKRNWSPLSDAGRFGTLIRAEAVELARRDRNALHPWFSADSPAPSGTLWHLYCLSIPPEFYDPFGLPGDPETIAPLLSQPLMEVCLRIPTYLHTRGGWDRAIARRAFARDVPAEIITRRSKGGMEEHAKGILNGNIHLVRDLLLDGVLVHQGILDRHKLEEILSGQASRLSSGMAEVFDYVSVEAWLRSWSESSQRAAA